MPFTVTLMATAVGSAHSSVRVSTDIPLAVTSAGSGSGSAAPATVSQSVSLNADVLPAGVTPTPGNVDFGSVPVGSTSLVKMVTVTNCTAGSAALGSATLTGPNKDEFDIAIPPAGSDIDSHGDVQVGVLMLPKHVGLRTATLQVAYAGGMVSVPLTGTGASNGASTTGATYYTCGSSAPDNGWLVVAAAIVVGRRRRRA